jgi:hypothetical protein
MSHRLRNIASATTPKIGRKLIQAYRLARMRVRNAERPLDEVFAEVYASRQWGEGDLFDSGSGSRGVAATRYVETVRAIVEGTGIRSAVDIGCGDFRVASRFANALDSYVGVDVVPSLIRRNTEVYTGPGVRFAVVDATTEDPPAAEICLIRQVLQHLSNDQIACILKRCERYPVVLVTEHWPAQKFAAKANIDKPHGPDTRLDRGSWVDISQPPFNCQQTREVLAVEVERPLYHSGEMIRTHLWHPQPS